MDEQTAVAGPPLTLGKPLSLSKFVSSFLKLGNDTYECYKFDSNMFNEL